MKKIHRFLVKNPPNDASFKIEDPDLVHLIKNVLKLNIGEKCIFFSDGGNDHLSTIVSIEKKYINLDVDSIIPKKDVPKNVTACISIVKKDNFELIVQKLTEIGVQNIIPIISEHTIKQALRIDRLQKISDEALEQSGGSFRVKIKEPETLETSLSKIKDLPIYCFDMGGKKIETKKQDELVFFIGPEGGWSQKDISIFEKYGAQIYTLGGTILRAETSAIVAGYKLIWD